VCLNSASDQKAHNHSDPDAEREVSKQLTEEHPDAGADGDAHGNGVIAGRTIGVAVTMVQDRISLIFGAEGLEPL